MKLSALIKEQIEALAKFGDIDVVFARPRWPHCEPKLMVHNIHNQPIILAVEAGVICEQ